MRNRFACLIGACLVLAACGGGGGSTSSATSTSGTTSGTTTTGTTTTGTTTTGTTTTGSSGTTTTGSSATAYNVVNAIVDSGPTSQANSNVAYVNIMYVNVTVCVPGSTSTCQTIDHVQVDTGSQGLRILSTALNSTMTAALQPIQLSSGGVLAECTQFVDGYSWGPLVTADVHVGGSDSATTGESAPGLPVQVIGAATYPVPTACSNTGGVAENTVAAFGANGVLGVGLFDQDCPACATNSSYGYYYSCTSSTCTASVVPVAQQSTNPVYKFAAVNGVTDSNGVIVELPAVGASGAATASGTLVFGIGTQSNNTLASGAKVLNADPDTGVVTTTYSGQSLTNSYLDSGSNALYFNDNTITACSQTIAKGFMCPSSTLSLTATITGASAGQSAGVTFSIANANTLFTSNLTYTAFANLGGAAGTSATDEKTFAWGLPFFYGKNVYTAMEKTVAGGSAGPYFAF